jgi:hypothetical protein
MTPVITTPNPAVPSTPRKKHGLPLGEAVANKFKDKL